MKPITYQLTDATMEYIEVSAEAVNAVKKGPTTTFSKLNSIKGIPFAEITADSLRKFGQVHQIPGHCKGNKTPLADAIAEEKANPNVKKAEAPKKVSCVNRKRYVIDANCRLISI